MSIVELFILALGLSMDAFAVSLCKGLSVREIKPRHGIITGLYFGGFQAFMPLLGYILGTSFRSVIEDFDHWVAFVLLLIIGANMIREAFSKEEEVLSDSFGFKVMLMMAVATSIDALASGIAISFLELSQMLTAAAFIGITTFTLSFAGVYIGQKFGGKFKAKAEFAGGAILILLGTKILLEHLGILGF